jgi:Uma2 family endonuclease
MVASITKSQLSLNEFLALPETEPASEYIDGEIYQKPMPQVKHSMIQTDLVPAINQIARPQKLAFAFTELRCTFASRSIVPDIAVFEWAHLPIDANGDPLNKVEIAPDWIIEILSPDQSTTKVINKILFSIKHGTKLGWLIDSDDKSVMIFQPNQLPEIKYNTEILPVLTVLENWEISAADIFSWLNFK